MDFEKGSPSSKKALRYRMATIEHLKRVAEGGTNAPANLTLACLFCNSHRGEWTPEQHKVVMGALIAAGGHPCVGAGVLALIEGRRPWRAFFKVSAQPHPQITIPVPHQSG